MKVIWNYKNRHTLEIAKRSLGKPDMGEMGGGGWGLKMENWKDISKRNLEIVSIVELEWQKATICMKKYKTMWRLGCDLLPRAKTSKFGWINMSNKIISGSSCKITELPSNNHHHHLKNQVKIKVVQPNQTKSKNKWPNFLQQCYPNLGVRDIDNIIY